MYYDDVESQAQKFRGVDTVLCFIVAAEAQSAFQAEENLIDASIKAAVRQFAASEWAM